MASDTTTGTPKDSSTASSYNPNLLPKKWQDSYYKFTGAEGGAVKLLGEIKSVQIKSRPEGPVHLSSYNPNDKELIISAYIVGTKGGKTCHIYQDGSGTMEANGRRV